MRRMDIYRLWLTAINGIGRKTVFRMWEMIGRDDFAELIYRMPEYELQAFTQQICDQPDRRGKANPAILEDLILCARRSIHPERLEEELQKKRIRFMTYGDGEYPEKLLEIPDPPFCLFCIGRMPDDRPSVSIIGARNATPYGREQARVFGGTLARYGMNVISGMARGIDGIAGRAALDAGGYSAAVLGCGADICYPSDNKDLYERLCQDGGVISEYMPGTSAQARLFPLRNRIISGLSDVVLVIEAAQKSGTLITVDMALDQNREIYALPGRVTDVRSGGCNRLIRQGAGIAASPEDIVIDLLGAQGVPMDRFGNARSTVCSAGLYGTGNAAGDGGIKTHRRISSSIDTGTGQRREVCGITAPYIQHGAEKDDNHCAGQFNKAEYPVERNTDEARTIKALQAASVSRGKERQQRRRDVFQGMNDTERLIASYLDESVPVSLQNIAEKLAVKEGANIPFSGLSTAAVKMQMKGMIRECGKGMYILQI